MMVRLGNFLFHYRNGLFALAYLLLFWRSPRIFSNHLLAVSLGLTLALTGQLLRAATIGLAYIIRGGRNRQVYAETLVQDGIFAHCRNPLYLGNFFILCGLGLAADSQLFLLVGVPFFTLAYGAIIAAEENYLRQKFGQEYEDYCARVNRFVPRLTGLRQTLQSMEFRWRRLVVKEYGSAYAWMAAMILLRIKDHWTRLGYAQTRAFIWTLTGLLMLLTMAYAWARYLKKSQKLKAD
jgi:protein-S-isoprenylcysteine O-methyltransferase Ste14